MAGMLHVTMQPREGLSLDQFHEWYNNEHGPTRLRLPHIFSNGLRYRDDKGFMACYDVTDMAHLETPTYTQLRANRSDREAATIGQVDVDRRFLDLISSDQSPLFVPTEQLTDDEADGLLLLGSTIVLRNDVEGAEDAVVKWHAEQHAPAIAVIPGWRRTRLFRTPSKVEGLTTEVAIMAFHDFIKPNGYEHTETLKAAWKLDPIREYLSSDNTRFWRLFYVFGPAPRDLQPLSSLPTTAAFTSDDARTSTTPSSSPAISSYITTADGLDIPYRLEGNHSPSAPAVAFCNSLLTSLRMWDPLVAILKSERPDLRILRYDTRGRHAVPGPPVPATLGMLSSDLATILSALRIPKLHALVGVSMGGATTLKFALTHPDKLGKFIACDFNVGSSDANTAGWKERIALAEDSSPDKGIAKLAGLTVERWFHPHTMTEKKDVAEWMTKMVGENSVQGFRYSCQALWDYNMREEMKACKVPGLLVVGDGDGKGALVKAMEGFKANVGQEGAELKIVEKAGHLPMCESPGGFWEATKAFL
ncbi:Alpha/Beta hydrolase protein [Bombardia bombarda]|uniref:Alpha/Beta hydrolase protein n=1 Tax=Bombardia bombarda TaxID=252184 RepID=A0AA39WG88_9PEZI|nr:Alpha/Beta hydrolase protein [Bombardia bombarda]